MGPISALILATEDKATDGMWSSTVELATRGGQVTIFLVVATALLVVLWKMMFRELFEILKHMFENYASAKECERITAEHGVQIEESKKVVANAHLEAMKTHAVIISNLERIQDKAAARMEEAKAS